MLTTKLFALIMPVLNFLGPWGDAFNNAASDIWSFIGEFLIPFVCLILAVLVVMDIVKAVANYRRGDDVQIVPILLLVAGIALLLVLRGDGSCSVLKSIVGLS